jgi:hypothetical protein
MNTLTVVPFLLAMFAAVAAMPTNIYQICAWNTGTIEIEPWRRRTSGALRSVAQSLRAWFAALWSPRLACACLAVLLAVLLVQLSVSDGVLLAIAPAAVPLVEKRTQLLREAEALKQADGTFKDDVSRTAFDAKLAEVEGLDTQIRTIEATPPPTPTPAVPSAAADERARVLGIQAAVRTAKLDEVFATDLVTRGVTLETARSEIFAKMAAASDATPTDPHIPHVAMGEDARDKWQRGASAWLMVRSGLAAMVAKHEGVTADKLDPGEFRGLSLLDLARESLTRAGQQVRGMDKMKLAGFAMSFRSNYQTTSDFSTLLENTMHKVLRAAYAIQLDTWSRWCGISTVSDFRTHNWYRTGALSVLEDLNEHGEFKNKNIPDGEKATHVVTTKGNIIAITRQVIVNDDLGAVMRLTEQLGRAGKLTIEKAAYALLAQNSGLGPTQSDAQPLFHANRANVGSGAAITMAALDADATVMAIQTDPNGEDILDLRPAVLLVPRGLEGTARSINQAEYDPDTTGKLQKPNIARGMFSDIVGTGRLTGTRRYLFADPAASPVFLVSFLDGQREPILETQDGWRTDGVEMKARLDVGVDVVDYRGAVTDAGA